MACTKLKKDMVESAIESLADAALKRKAKAYLQRRSHYRHGSESYGRKHPGRAVTDKERVDMYRLHQKGVSFRAIEEIFKLHPNSGNDAQRCVKAGKRLARQNA